MSHTHTAPHVRVHCIKISILGFYSPSADVHSAGGCPLFSKYPRPETVPLTPHWLALAWWHSLPFAAWAASTKIDLAIEWGPSPSGEGFGAFPGRVAAAAAKSLQSCPTLPDPVRPHRQQPTKLLCPWDSPGKNTGVGCHFLLQCMKVKSEREVVQSCPTLVGLFETPWTAAHQAPPSMGISRQEYWSGVTLPSLGGLAWHNLGGMKDTGEHTLLWNRVTGF